MLQRQICFILKHKSASFEKHLNSFETLRNAIKEVVKSSCSGNLVIFMDQGVHLVAKIGLIVTLSFFKIES